MNHRPTHRVSLSSVHVADTTLAQTSDIKQQISKHQICEARSGVSIASYTQRSNASLSYMSRKSICGKKKQKFDLLWINSRHLTIEKAVLLKRHHNFYRVPILQWVQLSLARSMFWKASCLFIVHVSLHTSLGEVNSSHGPWDIIVAIARKCWCKTHNQSNQTRSKMINEETIRCKKSYNMPCRISRSQSMMRSVSLTLLQ